MRARPSSDFFTFSLCGFSDLQCMLSPKMKRRSLMALKKELVNKVVVDGADIEAAYSEFEAANGAFMSDAIVVSLNAE